MKMILAAVIGVILVILSAAAVAIEIAGRYMRGGREYEEIKR